MDAQMTRAHDHHYDQDPLHHPAGVEGEEEHHEKKSILKKVKAKAKKVKKTLASKTHVGHGHEIEGDQDDEEDEEVVQDPEIHGAPMYESAAAKNSAMSPDVNATRASAGPGPGPTLGENVCPGTFQAKVTDPDSNVPPPSKHDSVAPWDTSFDHDAKPEQFKGTLGEKFKHTNAPTGTDGTKDRQEDHQAIKIGDPVPADEPASPKRHGAGHDENIGFFKAPLDEPPRDEFSLNTQKRRHEDVSPAKGSESGGNGDTGVTPILPSFDKMAISDDPQQHKEETVTTGSHDQFSPSPVPDKQFIPESFDATTDQNNPQDMNVDQSNTQQGGYTGKVSSVASAVADRAISAKNAVASKIGYGGNDQNAASQNVSEANLSGLEPPKQQQQSAYTEKLYSATGAITDKAAAAKNVVASKLGYGGTDNAPLRESETEKGDNVDVQSGGANVNVSDLEPPKPQGTYTEKLSSAAASAKNAVASKLGYGGTDNTPARGSEINKAGDDANAQSGGGVTGYGRQIASTVTGKLAPVYGTVAGAGSAVLSKIPGTGMGTQHKTGEDAGESGTGSVRDTDRGVGMKGYIAEKLKPSDEDKALSEVISGALHKRGNTVQEEKEGMGHTEGTIDVHETVKDALHKHNTDEDADGEKMNVPMGKVTESEEVANRLGSSEEERTGKVYPGTGNESPSTGVVDKVKGAFTNWFGKGGETNPSMAFNDQDTQSQGTIGEENAGGDGERRLQTN